MGDSCCAKIKTQQQQWYGLSSRDNNDNKQAHRSIKTTMCMWTMDWSSRNLLVTVALSVDPPSICGHADTERVIFKSWWWTATFSLNLTMWPQFVSRVWKTVPTCGQSVSSTMTCDSCGMWTDPLKHKVAWTLRGHTAHVWAQFLIHIQRRKLWK